MGGSDDEKAPRLFKAAKKGNKTKVDELIKGGGHDVNEKHNGKTALFVAAKLGHSDVVRALLAAPGIGVNLKNEKGKSPLKVARDNKHLEIATLLEAAGGTE